MPPKARHHYDMPMEVGDRFILCGPNATLRGPWWKQPQYWWQRHPWEPAAYSGHADDPASEKVHRADLDINFSEAFTINELHEGPKYISARVTVLRHEVWINIQKRNQQWAYNPDLWH